MLYNFYLRKLYEKRIIKKNLGGRLDSLKTVHNPQYFQNLQLYYKMNNSNNKKFYDRTKSYILLFSLVVGMPFFINICVIVMKISISAYSHIIFCYITQIHSKLKECIFNECLRKVLNNQFPLILLVTSHQFFFFIGSHNQFHHIT